MQFGGAEDDGGPPPGLRLDVEVERWPEWTRHETPKGDDMAYKERIQEKINGMGQRTAERIALWHAITESFEREGADGVEDELAGRMNSIETRFDTALAKLDDML